MLKGIRRSGKSTLLINHIRHLIGQGVDKKETLYVNFEDPRFDGDLNAELLEQILEVYKEYINHDSKPHVFLDEVQHVSQWEKWVLMGYELRKAQFYVTVSSSQLLSREFGTSLSGRFLYINVFPLGFREFLQFKQLPIPDKTSLVTQKLIYKKAFNTYLSIGGFPRACNLDEDLKRQELMMYYETIILKDIVARHNLKNYVNVKKVSLFLLSNIGKPLNLNKVRTALSLSYDLADKYFKYQKDTFLLYGVNQFHYSLSKQFANHSKVYCIDNGILNYNSFRFSEDYGRYLENFVFVELLRRGHEIYYYQEKKECDFVIMDGTTISQAIQVCRTLLDEATRKRELEGLYEAMEANGLSKGLILTEEEETEYEFDNMKVVVKPVWKWMLEQ